MSRDEPAGGDNRPYVRVRRGWPELLQRTGCDGWVRSDLRTPELLGVVASLLEGTGAPFGPVTVAWDRDVYLFQLSEPTRRGVYVKRYYPSGGLDGLRTCLGGHKAVAAWRVGQRFLRLGLPTATPIGLLRRRTAPWRVDYLLLTEGIPNAVSLADFVATHRLSPHARSGDQRQVTGHLLREVSSLLARLHRAGVYHGDFTARNIVLDALTLRPYLLDLDAVRSTHGVSRRRRLKNLDELGRNFLDLRVCSPLDRARFLRAYLAEAEPGYASLTDGHRRRLYHRWLVDVWRRTQFRLRKHGLSFEGPRGPHQLKSTREPEDDT